MEPVSDERPPGAPPTGRKSALAFFAVLLALFPPALLAQWASPVAGLAATQLFAFLLPSLVATAGSNLRLAPYLRLGRVRPALVLLGALCGGAAYLVAAGVMTVTQRLLPRDWVQAYDLTRLFEGPRWERFALAAIAALVAPVCEELTFRGYVQTTLSLRRRPAAAIAAGALLFATLHLDPVRFPALLGLAAVFGWLTWRGGSIWPAVGAHAVNNGLAAGLLLALGATEPASAPPLEAVVTMLAIGASALGLLLAAYHAVAPPPAPAADALVLVDPASPSIRWEPARVPRALALAALLGAAALVLLGLAGLVTGAHARAVIQARTARPSAGSPARSRRSVPAITSTCPSAPSAPASEARSSGRRTRRLAAGKGGVGGASGATRATRAISGWASASRSAVRQPPPTPAIATRGPAVSARWRSAASASSSLRAGSASPCDAPTPRCWNRRDGWPARAAAQASSATGAASIPPPGPGGGQTRSAGRAEPRW